jgi:hypothetical protein
MPSIRNRTWQVRRRRPRSKAWRSYEEVARHVLNDLASKFGLVRVDGKQLVAGLKSRTRWELDGKGVCAENSGIVVIEARRLARRLTQESAAGIAYRVWDTGAKGAIVVTPLGFQQGAKLIAEQAGITCVQLDPTSTPEQYILRLLREVMVKQQADSLQVSSSLVGGSLVTVAPYSEA